MKRMHLSPRSGRQSMNCVSCRPLRGLNVIFDIGVPGACAPGFMLSPASRAERNSSERENQLLLHAIRPRREIAEWDEEVWILPAPAQRILNEQQTLERHLLADPILKPKMTGADVHARPCP